MATTIAAMKGKFGSTDYYILAMKAKELVEKTVIPSEMEGWENQRIEEIEQRDLNYSRVKRAIAPYFASDPDRFTGAIILTADNFEPDNFEPISEVATRGLPKLYTTQAQIMGFLTLTGGERLIPLDGQHRLKAIQFAIEGKDEKGRDIPAIKPNADLADDDVMVILIPYEPKKARKIFTKVNRYAKPTTTGQNLITDDDDIIAVLSRAVANEIIGARLAKYTSNSLNDNDFYFTTLATIAECNRAILDAVIDEKIDNTRPVSDEKQKIYREEVFGVWNFLAKKVSLFDNMLMDKTKEGDDRRREVRGDYLLGKPVPQACLFKAFCKLTNPPDEIQALSEEEAVEKLNAIDWRKDSPDWDRLLMSGNKILTKNAKIAVDIICYRAGQKLSEAEEKDLHDRYLKVFSESEQEGKQLPPLL